MKLLFPAFVSHQLRFAMTGALLIMKFSLCILWMLCCNVWPSLRAENCRYIHCLPETGKPKPTKLIPTKNWSCLNKILERSWFNIILILKRLQWVSDFNQTSAGRSTSSSKKDALISVRSPYSYVIPVFRDLGQKPQRHGRVASRSGGQQSYGMLCREIRKKVELKIQVRP